KWSFVRAPAPSQTCESPRASASCASSAISAADLRPSRTTPTFIARGGYTTRTMSTPARRTAIRAGWIVAFDGNGHRLLRDGVVVIEGESIVYVGTRFDGTVDETVDARDRVLTPGLISTHAHLRSSPLDRSFVEDRGSPQFWYSGLFEYLPVRDGAQDLEGTLACIDFSMAELLRGGVTTVLD